MCRLAWMLVLIGLVSSAMMVLDVVSMAGDDVVATGAPPGLAATAVFTTIWGNTRVWAATPELAASAPRRAPAWRAGDSGRPVNAWWSLYSGLLMLVVAFGMRGLLRRW